MSFGNVTENDLIKFFAHGTALPAYGANWQINFHTADPGEAGVATTALPTWTGYAAVPVARDVTGWIICDGDAPYAPNAVGNAMKNATEITFPECDIGFVGDQDMTHGSISVVATGQILAKGALLAPIKVSALITPRFPAGTIVFKLD